MQYVSRHECRRLAQLEPDLRYAWMEGGDLPGHFALIRLEPESIVGTPDKPRTYKTFLSECVDYVAIFDPSGRISRSSIVDGKMPMVELRISKNDPSFVINGHWHDFNNRWRKPSWAVDLESYENLKAEGQAIEDKCNDASGEQSEKMWSRYRKEDQGLDATLTKQELITNLKLTGADKYEDGGGVKFTNYFTDKATHLKPEPPKAPSI